jgi:DNA-binding response OmpR family regulator
MEPYTLLVIARTQTLAKRLQDTLDAGRYLIRWVPSTVQALVLDVHPSLVMLELPPSGGARTVARLKRHSDAPLLAISRTGDPIPAQVDASLARPYRVERLAELIEDTLMTHSPHMLRAAGMSLDVETRRFQVNGALCQLRPIGCRILALLMARIGTIVPRDELFRRAWNTDDGDSTRALDVHMAHLRRQIETDPRRPKLILTERGVGYWLHPPE